MHCNKLIATMPAFKAELTASELRKKTSQFLPCSCTLSILLRSERACCSVLRFQLEDKGQWWDTELNILAMEPWGCVAAGWLPVLLRRCWPRQTVWPV